MLTPYLEFGGHVRAAVYLERRYLFSVDDVVEITFLEQCPGSAIDEMLGACRSLPPRYGYGHPLYIPDRNLPHVAEDVAQIYRV